MFTIPNIFDSTITPIIFYQITFDMNLIYAFSRVPIGKHTFVGSYKDSYGLPAEMRKDPTYSYGTLVKLTEDQWGNDSIVEYIDSKGKAKPNSDDAAMEVFICDKYGHILKQQSRDIGRHCRCC